MNAKPNIDLTIHDVNEHERDLLDQIWNCETREHFEELLDELTEEDQALAHSLVQLLHWAEIDQQVKNIRPRDQLAQEVLAMIKQASK